jgi:release factor glutamine methyltransferase
MTSTAARRVRFGQLDIEYDEQVLEPRPWTLAQSAWAAELLASSPEGPLLEICSGAGQIGLAAAAISGRPAVLVDASAPACAFARRNAAAAGLEDRVEVRHAPMTEALDPQERFPLVLADPPYIPSTDTSVFPEDPLSAIDGGADGLALARQCLDVGAAHLLAGGHLLVQLRDVAQAELLAAETAAATPPLLSRAAIREFEGRGVVLHLRRVEGVTSDEVGSAVDHLLDRARSGLDRVEPQDLDAEVRAGAVVVDIRPVEQRDRDGELPGALVVDRNVLEWRLDPTSPHRLPLVSGPDLRVVVVCDEGYSSSLAAATLQQLGLHRATDLVGGYQAWRLLRAAAPETPNPGSPAAAGAHAADGSPDR